MSDMSTGTGKVVVNRSMSLDGFIAGPGDAMDWISSPIGRRTRRTRMSPTSPVTSGKRSSRHWRSSPGLARIDLEPLSCTRSGAVTILRFGVRR